MTESDVRDAVLDILDVSKLPPNIAAQLDDQDYVTTRRPKRKTEDDGDEAGPEQKKKKNTVPEGLPATH